MNEGTKYANSIDSGIRGVLMLRCVEGKWTEIFAIILLHKNVMAEKSQCSALHLRRLTPHHCIILFWGVSNIREPLILGMAPISLLKAKNKYISTLAK